MKKLFLLISLTYILLIEQAAAAGLLQYQFFYFTREDDVDEFTYNRMNNWIFVGASLGKREQFFIGPSYHIWNKSNKLGTSANEDELSMTEFGATMIYFWDKTRIFKTSFTYNLKASGERTTAGATTEIDGTSMLFSVGFQAPVSRRMGIGISVNYHAISISEQVTGSVASETAESYTTIYPMAEFSYRF